MMASYEGLRKLTLGDKPVVIKCMQFRLVHEWMYFHCFNISEN